MIQNIEIRHFHLFCGAGGGAKGFNRGKAEVGNFRAKFRCIGGVDVDPAGIRDFGRAAGVPGTVLDMFDRQQYIDFHGHEPPAGWREIGPDDIRRAAGGERPNMVFLSAPCKGFSGLLSEKRSLSAKYQALNRLTVRGIILMLEAFGDDPPEVILFENVPRILNRGRELVDQITGVLQAYGYAVNPAGVHDCGQLGGLAQSRKRFLLIARHMAKIPPFIYEPLKRPLRSVGEVLGALPIPGLGLGGPMHRIPALQWKTWVRLAFVEAGSDWRSLNRLSVQDGYLKDYLILPDRHPNYLGVSRWEDPSVTIRGAANPSNGRFSVQDPRTEAFREGYGVTEWADSAGTITGDARPSKGAFAVQDPRFQGSGEYGQYGVKRWKDVGATVTSQSAPGGGPYSVSDPRPSGVRHNNVFRVVRFDQPSPSVTGGTGPTAGGLGVADPRRSGAFGVVKWEGPTGTVQGESFPSNGRFSVADPRATARAHGWGVLSWDRACGCLGGRSMPSNGRYSVSDPRMSWGEKRKNYQAGGHYGVLPWDSHSGAVSAAAGHDNGRWSIADPRLPGAIEQLVAVIIAEDGTWHRPFTTLELAALQGFVDPEEELQLDGVSDSAWRERIGNMVPPPAAEAIAGVIGRALLGARAGQTFMLSDTDIWVRQIAVALSVRPA